MNLQEGSKWIGNGFLRYLHRLEDFRGRFQLAGGVVPTVDGIGRRPSEELRRERKRLGRFGRFGRLGRLLRRRQRPAEAECGHQQSFNSHRGWMNVGHVEGAQLNILRSVPVTQWPFKAPPEREAAGPANSGRRWRLDAALIGWRFPQWGSWPNCRSFSRISLWIFLWDFSFSSFSSLCWCCCASGGSGYV